MNGWGRATRVLAALLLVLIAAPRARAEMFYQEVPKDGRIYVFAIGKEYAAWNKSGEIGKAVTRLGYGSNGETVIFDSEDAIALYNFKHDKPGEVFVKPVEPPKPKEESFVKVGGTLFTDYTYTDQPKITDADKNSVHKNEFEVRRAYINVAGGITDWVSFRITPDVTSRQATTVTPPTLPPGSPAPTEPTVTNSLDGSLTVRLKYGYAQVNLDKLLTRGSWIKIGQQQTPYLAFYEDNIYHYRFQGTLFIEREGFISSSDVGISAHYVLPNDYGDIHAGIYNGDTYTKSEANDQKAFQIRGSLRPLPKHDVLKGLRVHAFYDADHPVKGGERDRFSGDLSFEHKYVNAGFTYIDTKDQTSGLAGAKGVKASGWSAWATPRTGTGWEAFLRFDDFKPNKDVDARRMRTIAGVTYWLKVKSPLAVAAMAGYEHVKNDPALAKPNETRWVLWTYFNF